MAQDVEMSSGLRERRVVTQMLFISANNSNNWRESLVPNDDETTFIFGPIIFKICCETLWDRNRYLQT